MEMSSVSDKERARIESAMACHGVSKTVVRSHLGLELERHVSSLYDLVVHDTQLATSPHPPVPLSTGHIFAFPVCPLPLA